MDRGYLGTTPLGTERDDDAYLNFVEGVRVFNAAKLGPKMFERGNQAVEEYSQRTGHTPQNLEEVKGAVQDVPIVSSRNRIWRWSQEGIWNGVYYAYKQREPELLRELDVADRSGPGSVEYDPNFKYPEYFAKVEYHIQPGGYYADPLAGYVYHYGTKVFFTGRNDNDDIQRGIVNMLPLPADGQVRRVLDLACSSGQGATAFKERFPQAEVIGIDAGAPMVRYAHKRAVDMGLDVHFKQRMAEDTGFPDNSFDVINAFILFHEIPGDIAERVVREAHRMLRPGGYFAVADFPNRPTGFNSQMNGAAPTANDTVGGGQRMARSGAMAEYAGFIDGYWNGEPYAADFVHSDFTGLLKKYFRDVNPNLNPQNWIPIRIATK